MVIFHCYVSSPEGTQGLQNCLDYLEMRQPVSSCVTRSSQQGFRVLGFKKPRADPWWILMVGRSCFSTYFSRTRPGKLTCCELERSTMLFMGKYPLFQWSLFNSYVTNYQRVNNMAITCEITCEIPMKDPPCYSWVNTNYFNGHFSMAM